MSTIPRLWAAAALIGIIAAISPVSMPAYAQGEEQPAEGLTRKEIRQRQKAEDLFERGKRDYQSKSFFWAKRRLNNAVEMDPSLYEAHKILGMVHKEQGNLAEAYNSFVKYLAVKPDDTDVMLEAGIIGEKIQQDQRARIYLETGLEKQPGNLDAKMALARLNYREGYFDAAKQLLQDVTAKDAANGEAHLMLGMIYKDEGDREKAKEHLTKATQLLADQPEAHYILGKMAYDRGNFSEAIPHFLRIQDSFEPASEIHYTLAVCYLAEGDNDKALEQFEKTIKADPNYEQARYQAALLNYEKGDKRRAVNLLEDHAKANPGHFDSRLLLGRIHLEQGDEKKAEKWLTDAVEIQPDSGEALYLLGKTAFEREDYARAYPYLRRAQALDPKNTEIRYLLSETYLYLPDYQAVERELEWIIEREDDERAKQRLQEINKQKSELGTEPATGEEVSSIKTLAVVDFENSGSAPGYNWMSKGLSEIISQDLGIITSLQVVDRAALDKLMREEDLPAGSASPAMKRLGAGAILTGTYTVRGGDIQINAKLVDTETARVISTAKGSGPVEDVFAIEREVLAELLPAYVPVTPSEREALMTQPTVGINSMQDLAKGKELYYLGKGEQAQGYLQKVVDKNPEYTPAVSDLRSVQDAVSNAETLAIMTFKNATGNPEYDWMGRGIAESLTTDLKKITGIYLVERTEIDQAMEEMKLGMLGFLDEETAPQVGKLVGAGVILVGSYQVSNKKLRIDARLVDVETGAILLTEKIQGYEDDIFKLEEQLAVNIADALNVSLTAEEMAQLKEKPNIEKFKSYIISQSSFRVGEEGSASGDEEVINTVAVAKFRNLSGEKKYDFLEDAIPGYLVTELKSRAGMNMVERNQIDRAMGEMQMSSTSYVDEKSAPRIGQLVGAEAILVGFYQVQNNTIRVDARVIKTETGEVLKTVSVDGNVNDIFQIEEELTLEIMSALGVEAGAGTGAGLAEGGGAGSGRNAPLMAATYSFFLPGSSQYYLSEKKTKGTIMFVTDALLILGAAAMSMQSEQGFNDYSSSGDAAAYNDAVDQMALRNYMIYGIIGLGAYSAVDAYLEAKKAEKAAPPSQETPIVADTGPQPANK